VLAPGLLIGVLVNASGARARGEWSRIGPIWRLGLLYGAAAGIGCALVALAGEWLLSLLGQSAEVAAAGGALLVWVGIGLPFHFAGFATLYVLEGIGRANAGAKVLIPAVVINLLLNAVLVFDATGGFGATGALLATAAVRALILAALVWLLFRGTDRRAFGLDHWRLPPRAESRGLIRLGLAGGVALLGEASAFSSLTIFAGWIGERALAVHTILFNVLSAIFTTALAVGVATSVEVAAARALGDRNGMVQAAAAGMVCGLGLMGLFGGSMWLLSGHVAAAFTADPATAAAAAAVMGWLALFLLADGAQVCIHNAVRGMSDAWTATGINLVCYLGVMTTLAWFFAIPLGHGVAGLLQGGFAASLLVVLFLTLRFRALVRREAR
jgi:MATE family multidrug resistance protein